MLRHDLKQQYNSCASLTVSSLGQTRLLEYHDYIVCDVPCLGIGKSIGQVRADLSASLSLQLAKSPRTPTVSDRLSDNHIKTARTFGQSSATGIFITLEAIINRRPFRRC